MVANLRKLRALNLIYQTFGFGIVKIVSAFCGLFMKHLRVEIKRKSYNSYFTCWPFFSYGLESNNVTIVKRPWAKLVVIGGMVAIKCLGGNDINSGNSCLS